MAFVSHRPLPPPEHNLQSKQYSPPVYYKSIYTLPQPPPPPAFYAQPSPPQHIVSPLESVSTLPSNISPNSQILLYKKGPAAKALYTPAVLRPTENIRPRKAITFSVGGSNSPSPLTPPSSLQSSLDSLDRNLQRQSILSRRNTGENRQVGLDGVTLFEEELLSRDPEEPGYGKVTGCPTKIHWKADSTTTICDDPNCDRRFTYFNRKHHCRRCGSIFCDAHSSNLIPLNQDAEFHPYGHRVRGCDSCWRDFTGWEIKRLEVQSLRQRARNGDEECDLPQSPVSMASPVSVGDENKRRNWVQPPGTPGFNARGAAQVATSVPGDWCWSSF